jgi:hypothetical protein
MRDYRSVLQAIKNLLADRICLEGVVIDSIQGRINSRMSFPLDSGNLAESSRIGHVYSIPQR